MALAHQSYISAFLFIFEPLLVISACVDPANETQAEEFVQWAHFHTTVCKHSNVVRTLHSRTKSLPMYLVLEACSPGNLLHCLWSLRQVNFHRSDSSSHRSIKQETDAVINYGI